MDCTGKIVNALAGYFETKLGELPPSIQATVREAFWYGDWDALTPTQRIELAWQYDTPETDAQRLSHQHQLYAHASALAEKAKKAELKALAPAADLQHFLAYYEQRERAVKIVMPLDASIQEAGVELLNEQLVRLQAMPTPTGFEQAWQVAECARITTLISQAATPTFDLEKPLDVPTISVPEVAVPVMEVPNWKMRIQIEAAAHMKTLRAAGASPTTHSILDRMVTWCRNNEVMTDGGIYPKAGYLRTHVLGGRHWTPPR
jgi:hypothetical protein